MRIILKDNPDKRMIFRKMLSRVIDSIRISSEFFFIYEKFLRS
ncbi:hypothetical protein LEP1GSC188_4400 [Leptospira weilii serovar Topaz str. LT2116]|uniref:Uncharacterized protein n=2 Tax=Leptospira weilii TaxID=28184 RepID=M3H5A1_9LEPT|nr:hypothetical protein LEP1GSC188_4400 [Leptospira weilii serovar Topaz str. LT2116]EMJ64771.1 hypothetical protein LEP1GSC051_3269 [Leptospira sp. P2653]EMM70570.1 hypothetical protein LEP1GSC038_1220 [Leptospira weilii str. 2006001855]EMN43101.1 hypothetical protein LEP1GSC086_0264 [Leptospira weilii str. LNT 1234]